MTFCGYRVFHDREDFIRRFSFRDEYGVELSDVVGIILVELTKLGDVLKKPVETMTGEECWSVFFAYGADPKYKELLEKMVAVKEEIKMARELLQTISRDENERARFRARRKFQMDMEHGLIVARDEERIVIAKNALQKNMSIDDIADITGLTRKEVESLRATV